MSQNKEKLEKNCDTWTERLVDRKGQYIQFHGYSI